jgi:hypothetical protein
MQPFLISHLLRVALFCGAVRSLITVSTTLNEQVKTLHGQMEVDFGRHPDAEIYLSQPSLGPILGAWVLGEFGEVKPAQSCAGIASLCGHCADEVVPSATCQV